MGFSITWCAVPEAGVQRLLDHAGLSPTGRTEAAPESLVSMARLDNGWSLLWYNQYECPFLEPENLAEISQHHEVLVCRVEEHVMASSSELWSGGRRVWWISHEGEDGPIGLDTDGALPECFPDIRREMEAAQVAEGGEEGEVDYLFEIPLKVAQVITGFKHDEDSPHLTGDPFVVLSGPVAKKGFLGRLFK